MLGPNVETGSSTTAQSTTMMLKNMILRKYKN